MIEMQVFCMKHNRQARLMTNDHNYHDNAKSNKNKFQQTTTDDSPCKRRIDFLLERGTWQPRARDRHNKPLS